MRRKAATKEIGLASCTGRSPAHTAQYPRRRDEPHRSGVGWNESGRKQTRSWLLYGHLRRPPGDGLWRREPQAIRKTANAGQLPDVRERCDYLVCPMRFPSGANATQHRAGNRVCQLEIAVAATSVGSDHLVQHRAARDRHMIGPIRPRAAISEPVLPGSRRR